MAGFETKEGTNKIDNQATEGLSGVHNSLAYRVHEIEKHFHSVERWYGDDGDNSMSTANNLTAWTLTAGTGEAYGTEIQLSEANDISSSDFPDIPVYFDMHRIVIDVSSANDQNYMIQIWCGDTTFGEAELCTEIPYRTGGNAAEAVPIEAQMSRILVSKKIWARVKCSSNGATLTIRVGVHTYKG